MAAHNAADLAERLSTSKHRRSALRAAHADLLQRLTDACTSLDGISPSALPPPAPAVPRPPERPGLSAADTPPRLVSSFTAHAAISFADLLYSQGRSADAALDLSTACMREVTEAARVRIANRVPVADVCWFVQARRAAAPGVGLSISSSLSSPACAASMLLLWLSIQLESGLLLREQRYLEQFRDDSDHSIGPSDHRGEAATHNRARWSPHSTAEHEPAGSSHGGSETNADAGLEAHMHEGTEEGTGEAQSASCDAVASTECGASAGSAVASHRRRATDGSGCVLMQSANSLVTVEAGADSGEHDFDRLRTGVNGSVPISEGTQHIVEGIVRRFQRRLPPEEILPPLTRLLEVLQAALEPLMNAGKGAQAGEAALRGSECTAGAADNAAGAKHVAPVIPAAARPLLSVRDALQSTLDATISLLHSQERDAAAAVVSHEAHARHVKDLNGLMQDLELVIFLTGTDAGRAVAKLMIMAFAHNTRLPVQVQQERMHLDLYRQMELSSEQKQILVALWRSWHKKRRALDDAAAAARAALNAAAPPNGAPISPQVAAVLDGQPPPDAAASASDSASRPLTPRDPADSTAPGGDDALLHSYSDTDADGLSGVHGYTDTLRDFGTSDGIFRSGGSSGMDHPWEAVRAAPGLLGQCPATAQEAAAAVSAVDAAHAAVSQQLLDFSVYLFLPGEVFGMRELMLLMWAPIRGGMGPVDKVELCLQAVQQLRRETAFAGLDDLAV